MTTPAERIFDLIVKVFRHQFGSDTRVTYEKTFADFNGDEIDRIEIGMAIEEEFGIEIYDDAMAKWQTVGDLVGLVEEVLSRQVLQRAGG